MRLASHVFAFACSALAPLTRAHGDHGGLDPYGALRPQLSPGASLVLPSDPLFAEASIRWSAYLRPTYSALVEVATEADVLATVRFANNHSLPFLAVDGGHGWSSSLGKMKSGIAISFRRMKAIDISGDGKSARFDPGLTNGDVVRGLWKSNKHTVTANCLCTGLSGVMLGGGHGYLQGLYGLVADQILEARVVLADGSLVVASPKSHPDLFWALRGAGHNFGIMTSIKFKVYDNGPQGFNWTFTRMFFKQDKLERLAGLLDHLGPQRNHPAKLIYWASAWNVPALDPDHAVLPITFMYQGPAEELERFSRPFRSLGPLTDVTTKDVPYPDLFRLAGNLESDAACQKNRNQVLFHARRNSLPATTLRQAYNVFDGVMRKYGDPLGGSALFVEGYSKQAVTAVTAVDDKSTAFPWRKDVFLVAMDLPTTDPKQTEEFIRAGKKVRDIVARGNEGQELHTYVNYAWGDESLQARYGYEPWRLQKLRELKTKYDPCGKFDFFNPIPQARRTRCRGQDSPGYETQ